MPDARNGDVRGVKFLHNVWLQLFLGHYLKKKNAVTVGATGRRDQEAGKLSPDKKAGRSISNVLDRFLPQDPDHLDPRARIILPELRDHHHGEA